MTTKALYRQILRDTFSIVLNVSDDSLNFWPVVAVSLGLVGQDAADFVATMLFT